MNLARDLSDEVDNEDDLRMLEQEPMENNNLQEELQSHVENNNLNNVVLMEEIEDPHGMERMVDGHRDVVVDVVKSIAEDQEKVEALLITHEDTNKIFLLNKSLVCALHAPKMEVNVY
nr:unnamed protein product [Callosobruchus analis]